ncbi:MAG: extracellular solute-binding protein [Treponema sp.]|nr:extracellular solute-binding protein [Treponema sp.]
MKRIFCVLIGGLLIGLPLSAGGRRAGGGASGGQTGDSLTVACLEGWYPAVSINDNLPAWQEIEKRTGIHINWQASSDYDTAMQPVIASGSRLPDILLIPPSWSNAGVYKLGLDGVIRQLDDLIASSAPDIQKLFRENPALKAAVTAPDGKIYSICDAPMFVNNMVVQNALFIRQDWLDTLGLAVPVTLDDWYRVLTAFKERDPNGNGRPDEIPFGGTGILGNAMAWGSAFGLPVGSTGWWYDKSGKVFYVYTSPQYREFLQTMNRWYKEGLLDLELNRQAFNFEALTTTNVVGSFSMLSERVFQYNGFVEGAGVSGVNHVLVAPPPTPDGSNPEIIKREPTWNHYGITKDSRNPELAMRWINFVYGSDEGVTLTEWGIEGLSYRVVNGKKEYTDFVLNNPDGLDPYNALRSLGASDTILIRTPAEVYTALNQGSPAIPFGEQLLPYRVEPFPSIMLADENQAIVDRIQPDIDTYVNETLLKFLIGEIPLTEWDNYVRTVNSMGLEQLGRVRQWQYDRGK